MMQRLSLKALVIVFILGQAMLSGCATVVGAASSGPIEVDPNDRSFGTSIDDSRIETIAKVNIRKAHPDLKRAPITVTSYNKVVLLTGQVKTQELRTLAAQTVAQINTVRQVHNEIQVQAPISWVATVNDAWLTSKLKVKLMANKEIDSSDLQVITEDGTVHLMGMVPRAEAERAADVARKTNGVQRVVLAIEYTD